MSSGAVHHKATTSPPLLFTPLALVGERNRQQKTWLKVSVVFPECVRSTQLKGAVLKPGFMWVIYATISSSAPPAADPKPCRSSIPHLSVCVKPSACLMNVGWLKHGVWIALLVKYMPHADIETRGSNPPCSFCSTEWNLAFVKTLIFN